jgi:hypothetical protein
MCLSTCHSSNVYGSDCSTCSEYANCVSEWSDAGGPEYDRVSFPQEEEYPTIEEITSCTDSTIEDCIVCPNFDSKRLLCCL